MTDLNGLKAVITKILQDAGGFVTEEEIVQKVWRNSDYSCIQRSTIVGVLKLMVYQGSARKGNSYSIKECA